MRGTLLIVASLAGAEAATLCASRPSHPHHTWQADPEIGDTRVQNSGKLMLSRFDERNRLRTLDDMNAFERAQAVDDGPLLQPRCKRQQATAANAPDNF